MYGYKSFSQFETPIRGIYGTKIGTVGYLLVATGGKLYSRNKEFLYSIINITSDGSKCYYTRT